MTLLTYQIFKAVSEAGSFHKAADLMGLTPSAISHAVSGMEKELGFTVFTRSKSGVSLTSSGSQLLPYIYAVLNSDESLQQAVSEMNGLQQGTVKVGAFSSVCTNWMPELVMTDIPYDVRRYRMEPDASRMIGLATRGPGQMAPAVRILYRHIIDTYKNL